MPTLTLLTFVTLVLCFSYRPFLQCSSLMDKDQIEDFSDDIKEEYEEIREDHYDSLKVIPL